MREELISQYIDDELDLDEKVVFAEAVHRDRLFKDEAVELLRQEKELRALPPDPAPEVAFPPEPEPSRGRGRRLGIVAGALAAAAMVLFFLRAPDPGGPSGQTVSRRFVVYMPDARTAAITGSFNGWRPVPMAKAGPEGYWEISLELPPGEHRYSFLVDGTRRVADPTVWIREKDDFGSENSVLEVRT